MLENFAMRTLLPIMLRFALAVVFIFHGLQKVSPENGYGVRWADKMAAASSDKPAGSPEAQQAEKSQVLPVAVQIAVAWGELLGGVAIALGLLTRIAALGIIAIMVGAIVTVTGRGGFGGKEGFEYNFVLIVIAAALVITGAGTFSLDRVIKVKTRGPAVY